jgi:MtN3 and saliva related transmembrane protein
MSAVSTAAGWLPWLSADTVEVIGSVAAVLTTGSFIPQAWLTFRTRDVSGISLGMYSAFTVGVALWLVYGLAMGSVPMTVANGITLALAMGILGMKLWFGRGH